jgi:hypothetical protein
MCTKFKCIKYGFSFVLFSSNKNSNYFPDIFHRFFLVTAAHSFLLQKRAWYLYTNFFLTLNVVKEGEWIREIVWSLFYNISIPDYIASNVRMIEEWWNVLIYPLCILDMRMSVSVTVQLLRVQYVYRRMRTMILQVQKWANSAIGLSNTNTNKEFCDVGKRIHSAGK